MNSHYIVITDESLTKAMNKYTKWLDEQINSQFVDQNVDQKEMGNEKFDR